MSVLSGSVIVKVQGGKVATEEFYRVVMIVAGNKAMPAVKTRF